MARAWLDRRHQARGPVVVIAPDSGPSWPPDVRAFDAGHPTPTPGSARGAGAALDLARSIGAHDTLLVLLSGGASSLMAGPAPPLTLDDKVAVTRLLLRAGASIDQLNCVRRHLSAIKGGQLAAACRGRIETLAISDVCVPVEDDPAVIGSGPTSPDPTTYRDALAVVDAAGISASMPHAALKRLHDGADGRIEDTRNPAAPHWPGRRSASWRAGATPCARPRPRPRRWAIAWWCWTRLSSARLALRDPRW